MEYSFNNLDEDEKIIEEEKNTNNKINNFNNIENNNKNTNKKNINKIPIILLCVLIVLVFVLIILLLNDHSNSDKNNTNKSDNTENNSSDDTGKDNTDIKYDVNEKDSILLLNKYVLFNKDNMAVVTNLEGNVIDKIKLNSNDKLNYYINGKDIFFINSSDSENILYKIHDGKILKLYSLKGKNNGFIKDTKENIVGSFDDLNNKEVIYLINKDNYDSINLNDYNIKEKYVYNDKYIIIVKSNYFGIYDVKSDKELIEPKYKDIEYLNKDYFSASKDEKYGIIDINDKTILDFDYDSIKYMDGLYLVIYKNSLKVLDSNFVELAHVDNVKNSSNRILISTFGDKIIYLANKAVVIDKKASSILEFDFDDFYVYGNYLITSKDNSTIVTIYNKNLNVFGEYDTKTKDNDVRNTAIYLNSILVLNGEKFFELETGKSRKSVNLYRRTSQDYQVVYEPNKDGLITISYNDQELGSVTGVKLMDFLTSDNNGIKITKDYFIYSAGEVHFITKNVKVEE